MCIFSDQTIWGHTAMVQLEAYQRRIIQTLAIWIQMIIKIVSAVGGVIG